MTLDCRPATAADALLLADLNRQLIEDEGHRNPMNLAELTTRMQTWLAGPYRAVIFAQEGEPVAYALYRPEGDGIYLRQFFVARPFRRRGIGRQAMQRLINQIWPPQARISVEVLLNNPTGLAFWQAVGFQPYAITLARG